MDDALEAFTREDGMRQTDWRAFIRALTPHAAFAPAAVEPDIQGAEARLGVRLPAELRSLYLQSDGVRGEYDLGLVWPLARVVEDNLAFRGNADFAAMYMPFEPLLFFADAGNGDQFAYTVLAGEVRRLDVFVWDHETDSRGWAAPDLGLYLSWWLSGRLKV